MNGGIGPLANLDPENIPTNANAHQHHILAILRNVRRYYGSRLLNASHVTNNLRNQVGVLNNQLATERNQVNLLNSQLAAERLYQTRMVINAIIEQIENDEEEREKKPISFMILGFLGLLIVLLIHYFCY